MSRNISRAIQRLGWIAKLSKETLPGGLPRDRQAIRSLLNRIVLDVRAAVKLLSDESDGSDRSDLSDKKRPGLIPRHGGYRRLRSFQAAEIIYDSTVVFCDRFVDRRSRTCDQMVQAARSGRQNIAEGSAASATSKKTELKLTNVAKASLEELLLDFEDFLRQRRLRRWDRNAPEALTVRRKHLTVGMYQGKTDPYGIAEAPPEAAANTLICLVNQALYLLRRQIEKLEQDFAEKGGFTEKLYRVRTQYRNGR